MFKERFIKICNTSSVFWVIVSLWIVTLCTGCATNPNSEYIDKAVYYGLPIPNNLLETKPVTPPPSKESFIPFTPKNQGESLKLLVVQRNLLADYTMSLLGDVNICHNQIIAIKAVQNEHNTFIKEMNNPHE